MSRVSSAADHDAQHKQEELEDAVRNQTHAAQTRRQMTERYHQAVVRGRHPRSFPRDSALWVHANQSKERSVRLKRGQSLASVVGGDPSVFQSVTFQGSQISYDDIDGDPSFHPSRSAWSSQQGSGGGSLDLGAPPGTAGMGMFPPMFGSAPGTQESQYLMGASGELGERSASGVLRKEEEILEERKIASFQFGRRLSIQRTNAVKAAAKASSQQQGNRRRQQNQGGGNRRKISGMQQQQQRRHRATTLGTAESSMSTSSLSSVSPHDALAQVRARHGGGSTSGGTRQCVNRFVVVVAAAVAAAVVLAVVLAVVPVVVPAAVAVC
jgi:hypothetical protein